MKVVIINGSPRTQGFTASVLRNMEKALRDRGTEVDLIDLSRVSLSQCKGCCSCYTMGYCPIDDDGEMISSKIREADGLIMGSPTYASNVSGYMKVLIDRGHFVIEQLLQGKYCVTVATGENYGSSDAGKILDKLILYSGGRRVSKIVRNAPFNSIRTDMGVEDPEALKASEKLFTAISKNRSYPLQAVYHKIVFSFGIKPFVRRKGKTYQGVMDKWKELGIDFR